LQARRYPSLAINIARQQVLWSFIASWGNDAADSATAELSKNDL
jgi:hypothetical protein